MREVDLIRNLIDFIDTRGNNEIQSKSNSWEDSAQEQPPVSAVAIQVKPDQGQSEVGSEQSNLVNPTDVENPTDRDDLFIPLQAKIEMMKKLTGVPQKDETLKQSQEQGGPAPAEPVENPLRNMLSQRIHDMLDDDIIDV